MQDHNPSSENLMSSVLPRSDFGFQKSNPKHLAHRMYTQKSNSLTQLQQKKKKILQNLTLAQVRVYHQQSVPEVWEKLLVRRALIISELNRKD